MSRKPFSNLPASYFWLANRSISPCQWSNKIACSNPLNWCCRPPSFCSAARVILQWTVAPVVDSMWKLTPQTSVDAGRAQIVKGISASNYRHVRRRLRSPISTSLEIRGDSDPVSGGLHLAPRTMLVRCAGVATQSGAPHQALVAPYFLVEAVQYKGTCSEKD